MPNGFQSEPVGRSLPTARIEGLQRFGAGLEHRAIAQDRHRRGRFGLLVHDRALLRLHVLHDVVFRRGARLRRSGHNKAQRQRARDQCVSLVRFSGPKSLVHTRS